MKSLKTMLFFSACTVVLSFAMSFGYIQYIQHKNPESYVLDPQQAISRTEIQNIVKEFIVENPALIVESVDKMNVESARKENDRVANYIKENLAKIQNNPNDPRVANPKAKVIMVEFSDYRCGYCKRMMKTVDQLISNGVEVEIVFKEFPILGEFSDKAARAALAVNSIDKAKYIHFHRDMMYYSGPTTDEGILNIVKTLGISEEAFKKAEQSPNIDKILAENKRIAREIGVLGSPAYLIGEEYFPGALNYNEIVQIVQRLSRKN